MQIIKTEAYESGARPPLQSWDSTFPPEGYSLIPDELDTAIFYTYNGFVFLEISEENIVTSMRQNAEAWEVWKLSLPEPEEADNDAISTEEAIAILLGISGDGKLKRSDVEEKAATIQTMHTLVTQQRGVFTEDQVKAAVETFEEKALEKEVKIK